LNLLFLRRICVQIFCLVIIGTVMMILIPETNGNERELPNLLVKDNNQEPFTIQNRTDGSEALRFKKPLVMREFETSNSITQIQSDGHQIARALVQTMDGGFALAGYTDSEMLLVKTDDSGTMQWSQTYNRKQYSLALAVIQTMDGGFALFGYTGSLTLDSNDMWLVKTDATGVEQWNQTYGGTEDDFGLALIQTADGNFVLSGNTESFGAGDRDMWLINTDINGVMQWNQTYGGTGRESTCDLLQTADGGFALVGDTQSFGAGDRDMWLVKTDVDGNVQWAQTYGGIWDDGASALLQTADGNFVLSGNTESFGAGDWDMWLVKTDVNGTIKWNQTYGETETEFAGDIIQTTDGDFLLAGATESFGAGDRDMWLVKTDENGTMKWNQTYGETGTDYASELLQTTDGGFALAGCTDSFGSGDWDMWLVKTDENGVIQWDQNYGGKTETTDTPISIDGNTDFATQAGQKGWTGVGTQTDPYVIANLVIGGYCDDLIEVRNVDLYFIITNCSLINSDYCGIYFNNVSNGQIINNTLNDNENYGIHLEDSCNNTLTNNILNNNDASGLNLNGTAGNNTITLNSFLRNNFGGDSQAHDWSMDSIINNFYFNYWDDWTSPDDDRG
jgi:parallel beta-helix repeat protein